MTPEAGDFFGTEKLAEGLPIRCAELDDFFDGELPSESLDFFLTMAGEPISPSSRLRFFFFSDFGFS